MSITPDVVNCFQRRTTNYKTKWAQTIRSSSVAYAKVSVMIRVDGRSDDLLVFAETLKRMVCPSTTQLSWASCIKFSRSALESSIIIWRAASIDNEVYATSVHSAMKSLTVSTNKDMKNSKLEFGIVDLASKIWL
mmetsp:Transcript_50458/g.68606  ORF Transcript_50458/g.68606 Transcript_50458/m.68606 type:complete len:135 (+) Transcript_50458:390-794(+)